MDMQLSGKSIFISGSTQGIGYAIADVMLGEGASVIINGRTPERVDSALASLAESHPGAVISGISADFADGREVDGLIDKLDHIDVLVNNVGIFGLEDFAELSDDQWSRYFDINVMAGVRLARALLPAMLAKNWGRIIYVGTESAVDVPGEMIHYGATKAASLAVSNGLAKLTRGTGVTVNTVLGGPTYSDGVADTVHQIAGSQGITIEQMKAALVRPTSLIQRFIEPRELASLVAYLASPLASATNGASVRAEGGVLPTLL